MLLLIYGTDREKARARARGIRETLQEKRPEAELFSFDSESWQAGELPALIGGQGLFEKKYVVFCNQVCAEVSIRDEVVPALKDIADSENAFIFLEGALDAKTLRAFEKYAEKVYACTAPVKKNERFNTFALADALASGQKEKLWVLYQRALAAGIAPEEIHGVLAWKVRSSAGRNKKSAELSAALVDLYVCSRSGNSEWGLASALEHFILERV